MLVLFILAIVLLHKHMETTKTQLQETSRENSLLLKRMEATETQLEEIRKVEQSTKDLSKEYFKYRPDYKKYVLNIQVRYPSGKSNLNDIISSNKDSQLKQLAAAGREIQRFLSNHNENQYVLIIEGQASRDSYLYNYELSYKRALALMHFWINDSNIIFGNNCEILISGSGDGKLNTHSMREADNEKNQRFLIHILPKNIFENNENK